MRQQTDLSEPWTSPALHQLQHLPPNLAIAQVHRLGWKAHERRYRAWGGEGTTSRLDLACPWLVLQHATIFQGDALKLASWQHLPKKPTNRSGSSFWARLSLVAPGERELPLSGNSIQHDTRRKLSLVREPWSQIQEESFQRPPCWSHSIDRLI